MSHRFRTHPVMPAPRPLSSRHTHLSLTWLTLCLLMALLLSMTPTATQADQAPANRAPSPGAPPPEIALSVKNDTSAPLRQLASVSQTEHKIVAQPLLPLPKGQAGAKTRVFTTDAALQIAPVGAERLPGPLRSFEGIGNVDRLLPPDTNGDVGPNHYVQFVNISFAVFSKNGDLLFGPVNEATLFAGFGTGCEQYDSGDPIALYDHLADRWLLSYICLLYTSPSPRDRTRSRMPSSA